MTQDEIIQRPKGLEQDEVLRMAREAGVYTDSDDGETFLAMPETSFERFAALVAAHVKLQKAAEEYQAGYEAGQHDEREACAKVCEQVGQDWNYHGIAAAIRARSNNNGS